MYAIRRATGASAIRWHPERTRAASWQTRGAAPFGDDTKKFQRLDSYRRPDSDGPGNLFRVYEVSAMSHNDARENPAFEGCTNPLRNFPHGALTFMGLQHTLDWAAHGTIPPPA